MKLVRDNVPRKFPQHSYRSSTATERNLLLRLKVMEEAGEVVAARNVKELTEELGDLLEAVETVAAAAMISMEEVREGQREKRRRLGGLYGGWILTEYKEG